MIRIVLSCMFIGYTCLVSNIQAGQTYQDCPRCRKCLQRTHDMFHDELYTTFQNPMDPEEMPED